jgi:hypothetical protein
MFTNLKSSLYKQFNKHFSKNQFGNTFNKIKDIKIQTNKLKKSTKSESTDDEIITNKSTITIADKIKALSMKGLNFRNEDRKEEEKAEEPKAQNNKLDDEELRNIYIKEYDLFENSDDIEKPPTKEKRWQRFFTDVQAKILPDYNLAIKNSISQELNDFFYDLKRDLNDKQKIFFVKNLLLNSSKQTIFGYTEILKELYTRIISIKSSTFDIYDKNSLLLLIEVIHFLPNLAFHPFFKGNESIEEKDVIEMTNAIVKKANTGFKLFSKHFSMEEYLFILSTTAEKGFYDVYLVKYFFERFNSDELLNLLDSASYSVTYFNKKIDLQCAILSLVEKYINFTEITKDNLFPLFSDFVEKLLLKVYLFNISL